MASIIVPGGAREQRLFTARLEARDDGGDGESAPGLVGHAAVFNQRAVIGGMFVEVVEDKFFDVALKDEHDVRMLYNHNPDLLLARTSSGTLRLGKDKIGLTTDADLPDTSVSRDLQVLMSRGDVTQQSFSWTTAEDRWETLPDDDPDLPGGDIRYLVAVKRLYDVSPVTFPAYDQTDAALRDARALYESVHGARKTRATIEKVQQRERQLDLMSRRMTW